MTLHALTRCAALVFAVYGGYALLAFLLQRQVIYPGRQLLVRGLPPTGIVPINVVTDSGMSEAWFLPPLKANKGERCPLVIFFHGNGEVIDYLPEQTEGFRELGLAVLLVEYPGYGRSSGKPSEKSITETAVSAYDAVLKHDGIDPEKIIIFGRSLGGGAACALAARRPSAAMILQSVFTSTKPFFSNYLLPGFIARDVFDNAGVVSGYRQPLLLFHGSSDTLIPPTESRKLQQLASRARLIEFPCGHNDFPSEGREFYLQIALFLKEAGIVPLE